MSPDVDARLAAMESTLIALQSEGAALQSAVATLQSAVTALLPLLGAVEDVRRRQEDEMFNLLLIEKATRKTNA